MAEESEELTKKYNMAYLEVIMRYKDLIEENEMLSVAELPKLVTPDNSDVLAVVNKIKSSFLTYSYEENFADAAKAAFEYVSKEIAEISMPMQFWFTPEQVIRVGAGDTFDKAILLCSMLIALGGISTRIIVVAHDSERKIVVASEYNGKVIAMDMDEGIKEYPSKEALLEALGIGKKEELTAYEFNDKMYNDLA